MLTATTYIRPYKVVAGKGAVQTMEERFDYGLNPKKLGALSSYLCDPATAPAEFLLVKSQYQAETGRAVERGALFFQIRQAFPPGEVTAEEANQIGYETAMRWTKGKYQFFVCTHTDKGHLHNHIYFNSTAFDRSRKFHNFIGSSFALRRLSDRVCIEHDLSVIQNPKQHSKGRYLHYGQWIGEKPPSAKQRVRLAIVESLQKQPADFPAFLRLMEESGFLVKHGRGGVISFLAPGQDKVQALLQRDTRTSPKGREVHLFSGFLKCADCGRAITRSVGNNNNVYYACSTYKNRSRTACTMHSIKHNRLEAAVLFAVQQQIHLAVSYSEMIARINTAPVKKSQSIRLEELIASKERELAKISRYKQSLYQDWKDGEITQQDYRDMKADYERQIIALTDVLARLNAERAELANGVKSEHPALVAFTKHQNIDQLSRELLVELIDHIKVYENGNISVRFKFADEFRRIAEYIEINTTKPAVAG